MKKLSPDERAARNRESCRAWRQRNPDYCRLPPSDPEREKARCREYRRVRIDAQRQLLLDAGLAINPVGRPKKDPQGTARPERSRVRDEAYREYQKEYQRQYKARRLADGWVFTFCGMVPPSHAAVLKCGVDKLPTEQVRSSDVAP